MLKLNYICIQTFKQNNMSLESFASRHIGPRPSETSQMLKAIGVASIDELINQTVPEGIRLRKPLAIEKGMSEYEYLNELKTLASKNKLYRTYIGLGYYNTVIPSVILRNVLENPGWYTAYTPYQAEIAQGRLEALLNFQTMVMDLSGMEIANASLLDESTAAAEAMIMFANGRKSKEIKAGKNKFFVSETCFPQTIDLLKTRATPLGYELVIGNWQTTTIDESFFGVLLQYPNANGEVEDYAAFAANAKDKHAYVVVAADLMSLSLLTPPGEWGADAVVGSTQRFGVPMGYGGPHAAFFATRGDFKRHIPGRIIGVSKDQLGNLALRMALQTREQHIRRDKATSNICTAQALLAVMASMYAVYHGPVGIKKIASNVHRKAKSLVEALAKIGFKNENNYFFDTLHLTIDGVDVVNKEVLINKIEGAALADGINFRYENQSILISIDESTTIADLNDIVTVFERATGKSANEISEENVYQNTVLDFGVHVRTSPYLTHEVFNKYHSETDMMRYLKLLENKDLSLTHSMIALGSCTMKLNAASELMPITWPEFANLHPFAPIDQTQGYQDMFVDLNKSLSEITGFAAMSFQPNSGAQGEYTGLMVIQAYHHSRGDDQRDVVLIPSSAHGTNPASAVMAGMKVVVTKCDQDGNIDLVDLKEKTELHSNNLSALMVTYPSTHGVFEESIIEITDLIHSHGGQVYMDGANMNAQVGLTNPGNIGADVCHLNLHKTFAIPHGGGGPGVGPIGVASHLVPFLPSHSVITTGGENPISAVSAAPWGSALILLISYGYIKMLGAEGVTDATKIAILNANYIKERIGGKFQVLYTGKNNRVAHEMIVDCRIYKESGIEVEDIAKRLIDYGFHAPTVSFPVVGTLMIEPTESESKIELDRFCDAMLQIHEEIEEVASGKMDPIDNVLKNAPHTAERIISNDWNHAYDREKAAYPLSYIRAQKFWPSVGRVDNAFGDRNLICSCPSVESYAENFVA
ncbi:MAG: glycine dehydrogenase [Flavobacteriales bacterium]|jgi:glycine dehydrogenase